MTSAVVTSRGRQRKERRLTELSGLFKEYKVIGVLDLSGTRANILHEFRRRLGVRAVLKVAKKSLFMRAAESAGLRELKEYLERVKVPMGLVFTNMDAFNLKLELDKSRVLMHARPGERADVDVVVPEMNTGLPPGPILSEFGKMRIPTKIEGGSIWIARETLVAKKGDVISPSLASLLVRLDIKSVYKGLNIIVAYDSGILIGREQLELDLERVEKEFVEAHNTAFALAVEIQYPTRESIEPILAKAARNASALCLEAGHPEPETIKQLLARAESYALAIERLIASKPP